MPHLIINRNIPLGELVNFVCRSVSMDCNQDSALATITIHPSASKQPAQFRVTGRPGFSSEDDSRTCLCAKRSGGASSLSERRSRQVNKRLQGNFGKLVISCIHPSPLHTGHVASHLLLRTTYGPLSDMLNNSMSRTLPSVA